MGGDVHIDLFSVHGGVTLVGGFPVPVVFNGTSFTVILPLSLIGGDPNFNIAMVLGSFAEPTDCAPASGGCIQSPSGSICPLPPAPPNDNFADARVISEPLPFTDALSTLGATNEAGEASPCFIGDTVWYRFTPSVDVSLILDTFGSSFDTAIAAYDNLSSPPGSPHFLACNDNSGTTLQSRLRLPASAGVTYYFQVGGAFRARGDLVFNVTAAPVPNCPSGNDGFESGIVDSKVVPCWSVSYRLGSSGGWCNQSGFVAPQGDCAGSFASVAPPPEGLQSAMTNESGPGAHALYRCGYLSSSQISFSLYINNEAGTFFSPPSLDPFTGTNQQFRADLVDPSALNTDLFTVAPGDIALNLYQTRPGDPAISGYSVITADTSTFLGRNVCLRFAEVDNVFFFHAGVDAVSVSLDPQPPATATPTPSPTSTPTNTATASSTATPTPTLPCGDVTHDGRVTVRDLLQVALHIGRRHYDPRYDVNHDGRVDFTDLIIVLMQLGRRC